MGAEHWVGVAIFAVGVAVNAGVVWKGLSIVERAVLSLQEDLEASNSTIVRLEGELHSLQRDYQRVERKLYGPQ